jgi:Catalytic LigB subunit of aromatic ring-opening dioxygenase
MASIVAGIGASHSIMLMARLEDWPHFAQVDKERAKFYFDKAGNPTNYEALLAKAPARLDEFLLPNAVRARYERCQAGLAKLRNAIERIDPDIIVIIGDDQKEMLLEDNLPAFLIYWGKEIFNRPTTKTEVWDWYTEARRRYYEPVAKAFPVASDLGEHMVSALMDANFDVAQSTRQSEHVGEGEGHAFAFPREVLMPDKSVPVVPVCINAYYPPNQPSALRCYDFGKALARAVKSWPKSARVAFIATGGLSHFCLDEDFDRNLIAAMEHNDRNVIASVPAAKLKSGSGEIRNWIALAGAMEDLNLNWSDYVPCYRSLAGTGTGIAFAIWE